ncbi:MAG: UvrD-helicase domain-containing protein, partial [Candidatus Latescibacteria bacterium]|nr:UvrD-helicase domain-containing protein [Candidatus Latescibacterota bacterium]
MSDEQARKRAATDTDHDICLSAGAGSGKTSVLIQRLIHLLTEGHAELRQIVAITFTEKAAAELKTRLSEKLRSRLGGATGPAAWQYDLGQAYIGTIHGFCSMLLREHAVEAAVDPAFGVLDEAGRD